MELARIWEIILRRKWIILQSMLAVGLVAFVGSYMITPSYQASSKILMKKAKRSVGDEAKEWIGLPGLSSMIIRTHADVDANKVLAMSGPYLEEMVHKLQLRDEKGNLIRAIDLTEKGLVSTILSRISPRPSVSINKFELTDILLLSASSTDPREATMMANTLADIMISQNQAQIRGEYETAKRFLEDQMKRVRDRYLSSLKGSTDFSKTEKSIDLKLETELATKNLVELLRKKEEDAIELAQTRGRLAQLKIQLANQTPDYLYPDTLQESPQIAQLRKTLTDLDLQLSQATTEFTEKHPRVQSLRGQIELTKQELARELDAFESSAPQLIALERQVAAVEAHLAGINEDVERYLRDLGGIPDKIYRQESMGMELNVTEGIYKSILDSLYEISMGEATTLAEIRVIDPAIMPLSPVSPNKKVNIVLGTFMGLMLGFGLAFLVEYLDDTVKTLDDLKSFRPLPVLGIVGSFAERSISLITAKDPNDPLCESYRKIRNYLANGEQCVCALLVSSPGPGEGKSMTAANLAISMARDGRKTVIVDMDLRRPSLHTYFDAANDVGMGDLLLGNSGVNEAVQASPVEGLSLITSGTPCSDPGGLIESDKLVEVMAQLRTQFEIVILDAAPVLVKSDAMVLARHTDGMLLVVRAGQTTRRAITKMIELLLEARIRPCGFVLNGFTMKKGKPSFHHYYYGYGKELSSIEIS